MWRAASFPAPPSAASLPLPPVHSSGVPSFSLAGWFCHCGFASGFSARAESTLSGSGSGPTLRAWRKCAARTSAEFQLCNLEAAPHVGTVIDRAAPTDISALVELMSQFYAESNYALDRGWAAASFAQLLHDDSRGAAWIARFDGEPAGHIVLALRHSMEFGGLAGVIDDLFVRPEFRRRGIGSA